MLHSRRTTHASSQVVDLIPFPNDAYSRKVLGRLVGCTYVIVLLTTYLTYSDNYRLPITSVHTYFTHSKVPIPETEKYEEVRYVCRYLSIPAPNHLSPKKKHQLNTSSYSNAVTSKNYYYRKRKKTEQKKTYRCFTSHAHKRPYIHACMHTSMHTSMQAASPTHEPEEFLFPQCKKIKIISSGSTCRAELLHCLHCLHCYTVTRGWADFLQVAYF